MPRVYLGLGSNISADENLRLAIRELRWRYGPLELSNVYANEPVGFDGDEFLNMVAGFDTDESAADIHRQIELIHDLAGRDRGSGRYTSRPLDIDLLLYGSEVIDDPRFHIPRVDVLKYDFVLQPLAELAPELKHPETGQTMQQHWQAFVAQRPPLEPRSIDL
jgi:2-amino-4-hydroxy-6-hydroxymethyldihydropteridine diphosphokinase